MIVIFHCHDLVLVCKWIFYTWVLSHIFISAMFYHVYLILSISARSILAFEVNYDEPDIYAVECSWWTIAVKLTVMHELQIFKGKKFCYNRSLYLTLQWYKNARYFRIVPCFKILRIRFLRGAFERNMYASVSQQDYPQVYDTPSLDRTLRAY